MYTPEDIQRYFNPTILTYLERKNCGGSSGQKGTRYEDYFTVYKLALLAKDILESGLSVRLSSQLLAFVDDLIIDILNEPLQHYQLKNSPNVSWSRGHHPIHIDFANQHQLNQAVYGRESYLFLVVSDEACSVNLGQTIPASIQVFSQVFYFPYNLDVLALMEQVPEFQKALVYLSAFEHPNPDKIDYIVKALIGAWITSAPSGISGHDLLTKAQSQSPQYIRSFTAGLSLDVDVEQILSNIEDFKYNLAKGFLHWDYADGLQSGTPPYSIETDSFRRLQERIKARKPTTFEELENLL